uniref:DUF2249 domain-containing protein n=1 Tax=Magnetococcus massalia (strain MO-1) TaxID=451514 RepID=A0A1S7LH24_MAGMO|nr:conserved protein of unknown function [Candidatus Magnetococcus massalia]
MTHPTPPPEMVCKPLEGSTDPGDLQLRWQADSTICEILDVRELPPPEPLKAILEATVRIPPQRRLKVIHNRQPALLYSRLKERNLACETEIDEAAGLVILTIYHPTSP